MKIITTIDEIKNLIEDYKKAEHTIGFVPTMGALHEGHLSLVRRSVKENDITIVSVFVNPTQFNNPEDLENYPRDIDADNALLMSVGCDIVFFPSVDEIYPEPDTRVFNFGSLATVMEGVFRPGHFNGVGQVVSRLFDIVIPTRAYFGLKDFQQLAIIQRLVEIENYPIEIIPCDIVRENDGLAMSSRNLLLSEAHRKDASIIYETLLEASNSYSKRSVEETKSLVIDTINSNPLYEVEYFELVDLKTLKPISEWVPNQLCIGCIAVYADEVRLIDNIVFPKID